MKSCSCCDSFSYWYHLPVWFIYVSETILNIFISSTSSVILLYEYLLWNGCLEKWPDVFRGWTFSRRNQGDFSCFIFNFSFSFILLSVLCVLGLCIFFFNLYFCFWSMRIYVCMHFFVHVIRCMCLCEWLLSL